MSFLASKSGSLQSFSLLFFWDVSCFYLARSSDRGCQRSAPAGKLCSREGATGWHWKVGTETPTLTPQPWHEGARCMHQGYSTAKPPLAALRLLRTRRAGFGRGGNTVPRRAAARWVSPPLMCHSAGHDKAAVLDASPKLTSFPASCSEMCFSPKLLIYFFSSPLHPPK